MASKQVGYTLTFNAFLHVYVFRILYNLHVKVGLRTFGQQPTGYRRRTCIRTFQLNTKKLDLGLYAVY